MHISSHQFKRNARQALQDPTLQSALGLAKDGFVAKRAQAVAKLPEFEALRDAAKAIKDHSLAHLDFYLEYFERQVTRHGGQVHWAQTPREACDIILDICRQAEAKVIAKGKSMAGEEIALNEALEGAGFEVVETDLGEYIIQLADEPPSHIIAPAVHKTRAQVAALFAEHHPDSHAQREPVEIPALVAEAREQLRRRFLAADVGITGANFLVAETGSSVIVTNEGNGDLTATLPKVHIVTAGLEKIIPNTADVASVLRVLARSATGQEAGTYTTFSSGPKRAGDVDGPQAYHVVLIDNGRSRMLGNEFREMLRCIRCGACLNHCPVYSSIGGHAYGWVYSGPMGSVLTPLMIGLEKAQHLPNACTLNGRCQQVCPMRIPLPDMLRSLRHRQWEAELSSKLSRVGVNLWNALALRPWLYRMVTGFCIRGLAWLGRRRGRFSNLLFASAWTKGRDFPAPQTTTFQQAWRSRRS